MEATIAQKQAYNDMINLLMKSLNISFEAAAEKTLELMQGFKDSLEGGILTEPKVKPEVKKWQEYFSNNIIGSLYGACLRELIEDNGNTVFEWRISRETNRACIIEFSDTGYIIFKS